MGELRWSVFRAALAANGATPRLAALLVRRGESLPPVQRLQPHHRVDGFDCGVEALNLGLRRDAEVAASTDASGLRTWVAVEAGTAVAYYATRPRMLMRVARPEEPRIPLLLVRRFALDRRWRAARPTAAADLFADLLRRVLASPPDERPVAVMSFTLGPEVKRFFVRCGARPIADLLNPATIMATVADMEAALRMPA